MRDPIGKRQMLVEASKTLTPAQQREHKRLAKETSRMWRDFWIRVLKSKGLSNVEIAKKMDLAESTVRAILKKQS